MIAIGNIGLMAEEKEQIEQLLRNANVNVFIKLYPNADVLIIPPIDAPVYSNSFNCIRIEDVKELNKFLGKYLGEIKRTGIQNNWEIWDATKLKVGTKIYQHSSKLNIIIAIEDSQYIPYFVVMDYEI
jgi:hypothetical protein